MRIFHKNNGLQSASMKRHFLKIIHKMIQILQHNLLVVFGSKQGGQTLKFVIPKHEDWASIQLLTLSVLIFLFAEMSSYFSTKANKRKVSKYLTCLKEFLDGFDLVIFLEVFARMSHILLRLSIYVKGPCKVYKSNRESTFFCFCFQHNSKTKFIDPSSIQKQKQKVYCLFFFYVAFVFRMGFLHMRSQRVHIR